MTHHHPPKIIQQFRGFGVASLAFALILAACDDDDGNRPGPGDADADTAGDQGVDPLPDSVTDVPPDTADALPDTEPDAGDVAEEADVIVPPNEFGLVYAFEDGDPVGIHDLMGVALTDARIYVSGLFGETARVSFFERGETAVPWCLHDGFGWPTGIAEDPTTGDIVVADMVYGLAIVTPPAETGDCGCDVGAVDGPCDVRFVAIDDDAIGVGGVAVAADGTIYASSLLRLETSADGHAAGNAIIWALTPDGDDGYDVTIAAEGLSLGDAIGLELNGGDDQILVADSDGALVILIEEEDAWDLLPAALQTGSTGFPTDTAIDANHYFWGLQSPFAHPDRDEGGSVLRITLEGDAEDEFGADDLVWPAGIATDGDEWYVVDRATGLWGFF